MKYRIKKETKPTLPTFGKYKAVAVHQQEISGRQVIKEAARRSGLHAGDITAALISVAEVVNYHLRTGAKVHIPEWGHAKLEIESEKVDKLEDFSAKKHIRNVRLHFIPESYDGSQALYKDIHFEKDKTVYSE